MEDWLQMRASALGEGIGAGRIDPVALTETYLAAIEASPFRDRIYSAVTPARARAEAKASAERAKSGMRRSALDGVPISWKDLFDSAGTATEAGTALMKGRVPERDAVVLENATRAGLVCLGKTHMTEIAFSGLGLNPITATPPNRHDPERVPGGSSSGAAASVAYGLAAAGIGSDTGGSVRVPSAWNDLVGFKPTHGELSVEGVVPLASRFDTVGPLCRSVADAAMLASAMAGAPARVPQPMPMGKLRLGVLMTMVQEELAPEIAQGWASACDALTGAGLGAGATLVPFEAPELERAFAIAGPLYTADAWANWGARIEQAPEKMYHQIYKRIRPGADVTAQAFLNAWQRLEEIRAEFQARMREFDAVIMPSVPNLPPAITALETDADLFVSENLMALRNTRVGNLMGLCAITLPTGVPWAGIMLNGLPGEGAKLLRVAAGVEQALA